MSAGRRVGPAGTRPDCTLAVSFNNFIPRGSNVSATDVIAKAILERLYLVSGLRKFALRVNCPYTSTPTAQSPATSRFSGNFSRKWRLIFLVSTIRQVVWQNPYTLVGINKKIIIIERGEIRWKRGNHVSTRILKSLVRFRIHVRKCVHDSWFVRKILGSKCENAIAGVETKKEI